MYALGMVVYEIVTGVRPFGMENLGAREVMWEVLDGARPMKPEDAEAIGFGGGVWDLVERCWREDWTQRPKVGEARRRLTVAAAMSPTIPPGPTVNFLPARETGAGSIVSSTPSKRFPPFVPLPTYL